MLGSGAQETGERNEDQVKAGPKKMGIEDLLDKDSNGDDDDDDDYVYDMDQFGEGEKEDEDNNGSPSENRLIKVVTNRKMTATAQDSEEPGNWDFNAGFSQGLMDDLDNDN